MRQGNDLLNGRSRTDQKRCGEKEPGGTPASELQWRVTLVLNAGVTLRGGTSPLDPLGDRCEKMKECPNAMGDWAALCKGQREKLVGFADSSA